VALVARPPPLSRDVVVSVAALPRRVPPHAKSSKKYFKALSFML
jgi:hypothetical protein